MNTQVVRPASPPPPPSRKRTSMEALRPVLMAGVLLGVLVLAALLAALLTRGCGPDGSNFTLTVRKPTGGTLIGDGITCGTEGTTCSTSVRDGQVVELRAQPDEGYTFAGYMLDCAPSGRLEMKAARICGARFDEIRTVGGGARWTLTLTAPENGTIVTDEGHECGPRRKLCTAEVEEGKIVHLDVLPDDGYRLQSFTGDCADGTANMTKDRSCGVALVKGTGPPPVQTKPSDTLTTSGGTASGGPIRPPSTGGVTTPPPPPGATGKGSPTTVPPTSPPPTSTGQTATVDPPPATQPPGTPPPPVTPVAPRQGTPEEAKKMAEGDIQRVLKAYRSAYERMDIPALKRLQPAINVASHELRFKDLKAVKYTFGGDPQIEDLDVELGRAKAIVDLKTENEQKSGKKQKPAEGKATYLLRRIGMGENWEIIKIDYAMSEK
jgi:hypothetical protein